MKHLIRKIIHRALVGVWVTGASGLAGQAFAQAAYPSADAAAQALVSSIATSDQDQLKHVLGADFHRYVPRDSVSQEDIYAFLAGWSKHHEVVSTGPASAALVVGEHDWTFPAPIVEGKNGWRFDVREGAREMQRRRIDRNEIAAMETLRVLCAAQERYRSSVGQGKPAQRIVSREGQYDGLYWEPTGQSSPPSPLTDDALVMGPEVPADAALHGYRYAMLSPADETGCAFAAWPAKYGQSGVHSFVIGPQGNILERDFGRPSTIKDHRSVAETSPGWAQALP